MNNTLKYKGYTGSVEADLCDDILYGHILFIDDFVAYEGKNITDLKSAFERTVDEYISDCEALGLQPNTPFSGQFSIRTSPEHHKKLATLAADSGISINDLVNKIFDKYINEPKGAFGGTVTVVHNNNYQGTFSDSSSYGEREVVWQN